MREHFSCTRISRITIGVDIIPLPVGWRKISSYAYTGNVWNINKIGFLLAKSIFSNVLVVKNKKWVTIQLALG